MTDDNQTDDDEQIDSLTVKPGARYTSNGEILRIERELRADGVELQNPALPGEEHPTVGTISVEECRRRIATEADTAEPRRDRIAGLNARIERLEP
jgi:hypothetical protein